MPQQVSQSAVDQADDPICSLNGDRASAQSDVESDDHSEEEIVVPKPSTVVPVPTPRRTLGLSVTPQIDKSSLAQSNGSVRAVHLDSADVAFSGSGEALSDELVGHGEGIELGVRTLMGQRKQWSVQAPQTQILVETAHLRPDFVYDFN